MDDFLPFFEGFCQEEEEAMDKCARECHSTSDQAVMGIPTHFQNDGSYLYILTPAFSPPAADSVYRWLSCYDKGKLELMNVLT